MRYVHALRFAVGLHGTQKSHPIIKYKHYQLSSGARASENNYHVKVCQCSCSLREVSVTQFNSCEVVRQIPEIDNLHCMCVTSQVTKLHLHSKNKNYPNFN